mmetsp:Transcript_10856/g.16350  ORF Transcript_10856/g.16350 Transcript_10856/m.16350 type:complete len:824 (-) Transcript_10856:1050-3521(-)
MMMYIGRLSALLAIVAAPFSSAFTARGNGLLNLLSSTTAATSNLHISSIIHNKQQQSSLHLMSPHEIMDADSISTATSFILSRGSRGSMENAVPPSEGVTLTILTAGFAAIVWFLANEYKYLKEKSNVMDGALNKKERDFTWIDLIDYRLDYFFSTNEWAKVILLFGLSYVLVVFGAGLLVIGDSDDYDTISEAAWTSWTYVVDPGAQADAPSELIPRAVSLFVTLGGLLVFALLIGIVGESIGEKIEDLKTGKSRVFESDHTLMLNWNDKSIAVIQQIALANESEGGRVMVVLSQLEKEEMEERLESAINAKENPLDLMGTEVVFRQGNPILENDLKKVSANTARAVIALTPPDFDSDEADANMLRQVLALKALDEDFGSDGERHVVVELQDVDNKELIKMVAPDFAEIIVNHDMIGRLMLQCARTPELAYVLDSMMGFEGSEFYFDTWPELYGKTFKEITVRFDEAIPVGFRSEDGDVRVNPVDDDVYQEGEEILVLAEDDDSYEPNDGTYPLTAGDCIGNEEECPIYDAVRPPEKILFCGWRRDMSDLISQLDEFVPAGSELWLLNKIPANMREERLLDGGNKAKLKLKNIIMKNVVGDHIIRRDLKRIWDTNAQGEYTGEKVTLDQFDSILILSDETAMKSGEKGSTSSDSRSLAAVLIIQDMMEKMYQLKKRKFASSSEPIKPPCVPVSEILDTRTKSLLNVANCKGYVLSNQIVSSVMAQVAEEKDINVVLSELFSSDGSETYIRPVEKFVDLDEEDTLSFWDVALKARQYREVVVGYKPADLDYDDAEELIINPPNKSVPRRWKEGDKIVVFSLED